jgi:CheY-like chemotaxis protein
MRILFVEDDPMNRRVVRDMLQLVGAEMHEADSARAGLDKIEAERFDIVLMDLRMPGMDGMEAIGHIRGRGDNKAMLPIIVVTADTALGIRENCVRGGADEVIMKPVAMKQLFDAIGKAFVRAAENVPPPAAAA